MVLRVFGAAGGRPSSLRVPSSVLDAAFEMRTSSLRLTSALALCLAACASNSSSPDAGSADSGSAPADDAAVTPVIDGGAPVADAGSASTDAGSTSTDAGSPSTDAGSVATDGGLTSFGPVPLSSRNFATNGSSDKRAVFDIFAGTHPVVVYATHATKTSAIGLGALEVTRNGSVGRMVLKDSAGQTITAVQNDFDAPVGGSISFLNLTRSYKGDVLVQQGSDAIDVRFGNGDTTAAGQIQGKSGIDAAWAGNAGGEKTTYFRNHVTYAGTRVPEAFARLAGTYKGTQGDNALGGVPEVTVVVKADGTITMSGVEKFSQQFRSLTVQWDGNDDFIAPNVQSVGGVTQVAPGEFQIVINANQGYGARPAGGITLTVPALESLAATPKVLMARAAGGAVLVVANPTRQ
jgi:hypothetical protein